MEKQHLLLHSCEVRGWEGESCWLCAQMRPPGPAHAAPSAGTDLSEPKGHCALWSRDPSTGVGGIRAAFV